MFILTSEIDQKLMIGDDIKVVVLDIKDNQVKIGLDTPKETSIIRDDLDSKGDILHFSSR